MNTFIQNIYALYTIRITLVVACLLEQGRYKPGAFLKRFWSTQDFAHMRPANKPSLKLAWLLRVALLMQYALGAALIVTGIYAKNGDGLAPLGAAVILIFPILWVHIVAVLLVLRKLSLKPRTLKNVGRSMVCAVLEWQVSRLRRKHAFKIIAVAGSIGKTSTKLAIAHVLSASHKVVYQKGNYNDRVTVPLVVFEQPLPALWNVNAWIRTFILNEVKILKGYKYEYAVLELGVDHPGEMKHFAYLQPDLLVITALTEEHIEQFRSLEGAVKEELVATTFSKRVLINTDNAPVTFLKNLEYVSYGLNPKSLYHATAKTAPKLEGQNAVFSLAGHTLKTKIPLLGEQGLKIALAAAAATDMAGVSVANIEKGMTVLQPVSGRMQVLSGIRDSILIDDTYNASPAAVEAALDVLYDAKSSQRIAILGSMNELGTYSKKAHQEVGAYCDPDKLDYVVTIGQEAERYLAPVAIAKGCRVVSFLSPYEAGNFVEKELKKGAVVLAKGSQNRVFAEEALKPLLLQKKDVSRLVRQSGYWMNVKQKQF